MKAKELLIPRFEVIGIYPNSKFKEGDILERIPNATNNWYNSDKSLINAGILLEEIEQYPNLFKKLDWWEKRNLEDLPKYFIGKHKGNDIYNKTGIWIMGEVYPITIVNGITFYAPYSRPITEEEYLTNKPNQ